MSVDPNLSPCVIRVDDQDIAAAVGENLVDVLARADRYIPHLCYNKALGPLQTCDTCFVSIGGLLTRACSVRAADGLTVQTRDASSQAASSRRRARCVSAFSRSASDRPSRPVDSNVMLI